MKKLLTLNLLLASITLSLIPASHAASTDSARYTLEKVVMLSRHGVRPQTDTASLEEATGKKWPEWNVPDGFLTGHGYAGMLTQGAYQLAEWRSRGLPIGAGATCPESGKVWLWAAPDQRTKATGAALLDGMFPGCGMVTHVSANKFDPLFDTIEMGIAKPNEQLVYQQVRERTGSSEQAQKTHAKAVADLRRAVCAEDGKSCEFLDKEWVVKINDKGKAKLSGPVSKGSSIGETIRLQYSENLPLSQVAFGHAKNAQEVSNLMALHAEKYNLVSNTPEYASHGGSLLMRQLIGALSDNNEGSKSTELKSPLVILVGHDSNISQIQTMLGFNWQLPIYPRNDIPPGGSLIMERYLDKQTGEKMVHLTFSARTLDQWRQLSPLNAQHPLPVAEFKSPECHETAIGELCPLNKFIQLAEKNLVDDGKDLAVFQ
ncbi:histidine-type phosphatase [Raoultella terrigena]|uniref:histidine-type phosphatase n=1 Tax=Raoultella terrigena TaxID=577 RepID=UPI001F310A9D|nr:histidine-type phosphatase [Raoultella terrigena]